MVTRRLVPLLRRASPRPVRFARALSGRSPVELPERARVVVVGGGIIGTSTAYHLAKRGWTDVVLLERDALTSGTTWHAAGLMVTFGSLSATSTEWRKYSKALYGSLEAETGQATGFKPCGFIELATDADRLEEYRRVAAHNRSQGVDVLEIGPRDVEDLFPLIETENVLRGFYVADDGRVNPVDAATALAKGFRQMGGTIVEGVAVGDVTSRDGRVDGVVVADGRRIEADYVVNACGMWARQFGEAHGVCVPNQAAEHYYLLTGAMDDVDPDWPVVEDPSSYTYVRPEGGGLLVGLFEPDAAPWNVGRIPDDASFADLEPDMERMGPFLEKALARVPRAADAGVRKFFCGPESFAPDLGPLVGESPELRNYFVAAGMNSIGILTGPGVGRTVANWIVDGVPDADVCGVHVDRTKDFMRAPAYRAARVAEALGDVYACHYPYKHPKSARDVCRSPLHSALEARGAAFRAVSGYEGADYYGGGGTGDLTWGKPAFFARWAAEHGAVRNAAGLIDMSFMSKIAVSGPDAAAVLQRLSTANIEPDGCSETAGAITYCQWLADRGTVEADLTVTRLPDFWADRTGVCARFGDFDAKWPRFLVVATDTAHRHVLALLRREIREDEICAFNDATPALAMIAIQGPRSRRVLEAAGVDIATGLPFRGVGLASVGYCPNVLVARTTYVGELGYELFVPADQALDVHAAVVRAGEPLGLEHVGLRALGSLRLEKGYRDFGHDVDNEDGPCDVGLSFTCDFSKDFVGREAVLKAKGEARTRRLVSVRIDDPDAWAFHGEIVYRDGRSVGDVRAASYGHTVGGAVGLAMVHSAAGVAATKKWVDAGSWEVDVAGRRYPATVSLSAPYDPKNARVHA